MEHRNIGHQILERGKQAVEFVGKNKGKAALVGALTITAVRSILAPGVDASNAYIHWSFLRVATSPNLLVMSGPAHELNDSGELPNGYRIDMTTCQDVAWAQHTNAQRCDVTKDGTRAGQAMVSKVFNEVTAVVDTTKDY